MKKTAENRIYICTLTLVPDVVLFTRRQEGEGTDSRSEPTAGSPGRVL